MHGKVIAIKPAALQKKRENRNAVALDSEQNAVQVGDVVKVIKQLTDHLVCVTLQHRLF
jgi:transcription elongation factor SPT5